jgi:RND family efflux transporter MFP subunit
MNGRLQWAALAAALGSAACGGEAPEATRGPAPRETRRVATAVVRAVSGSESVRVPATVLARSRATLSARISAGVVELPFEEGARVANGAVVVRLDDGALRSGLAAAEASLEAARADMKRVEALLERDAATPREREQTAARVAAAEAASEAAREALSYAVLRAPFAARVGALPVNVGDVVSSGESLAVLEGAGGFEIQASVGAEHVDRVELGQELEAEIDGVAAPVSATIRAVAPGGDPRTHRVEIKADLADTPGVRSGSFARLTLPTGTGERRLMIPVDACFERGGLTGVFVVDEGVARLRWIAAGARSGEHMEVRAGLEAGEQVVLEPSGLEDGTPVEEQG